MEYTDEEIHEIHKLANKIVNEFHKVDRSGRLLYLLVCKISAITRLLAYRVSNEHLFRIIEDEDGK